MGNYDHLPPEIRAAYQEQERQNDIARMQDDVKKGEFASFIGELSLDQVKTLREILNACIDEANRYTLLGLLAGAIVYKHGAAWNGESAQDFFKDSFTKEDGDKIMFDPTPAEQSEPPWSAVTDEEFLAAWEEALEWNAQRERLMDQYGIEQGRDTETKELFLRCRKCHVFVHSLEDRMLREPREDGCLSCQKKAAHG